MTTHTTAVPPPLAQPAPGSTRLAGELAGSFSGIAALAAAFAGIITYGREPDILPTAMAMGLTFVGALLGLYVLQFVFRLVVTVTKLALFAAAVLLVGCLCDWTWAESAADWLWHFGGQVAEAAEKGWVAWQAR